MFEKLPESAGNTIGFKLTGALTEEDYTNVFVPQIERLMAEHGHVRMLVLVEKYSGWRLRDALADFRRGIEHSGQIDRIAVVSEKRALAWITPLIAHFTKGEIRHFKRTDMAEAWKWVREG